MASITREPNGRKTIQFVSGDGKRRSIRLGNVTSKQAEAVKVRIEQLVAASITGHAVDPETSRWVTTLDDTLYTKLAAVGLAPRKDAAKLGVFLDDYIQSRVDIKPRTRVNLKHTQRYLLDCFNADRPLRAFIAGDAEAFRLHLIGQGKSENTVRRAIGRARQFFRAAIRRGLIHVNPFEGIAASVRANPQRFHFVSRTDAQKVLNLCPDAQWRLIFALARFGGLRCPSEVLALTWADVNWEHNRIRVPSPKTEHIDGKDSRTIPLFPELHPYLMEVFEQAQPGTEYVITRYRDANANLRTQLKRIIRRAGLEPWPKLFQNLRSTRETELAEIFPMHVVCRWIGNSEPVAAKHYLQLTDEHFDRAIKGEQNKAVQNPVQQPAETARTQSKHDQATNEESPVFQGFSSDCNSLQNQGIPPTGVELDSLSLCNNSHLEISDSAGGAKSGAVGAQTSSFAPDLQSVIDAWPTLPEALKAGIVAMVKAAGKPAS